MSHKSEITIKNLILHVNEQSYKIIKENPKLNLYLLNLLILIFPTNDQQNKDKKKRLLNFGNVCITYGDAIV
jgi:hypothetical protein